MQSNIVLYVAGSALVMLLLSRTVTSQYYGVDEPIDVDTREQGLAYPDGDGEAAFQGVAKRLSDYFQAQKRHLCRRYFIYNPVRGRCQPTLMGLKLMRAKAHRAFPSPQAWAKLW